MKNQEKEMVKWQEEIERKAIEEQKEQQKEKEIMQNVVSNIIDSNEFREFLREQIPIADNSAWKGWWMDIYYTPSTNRIFTSEPRSNGYSTFADDTICIGKINCRCIEQDYQCESINFEKKTFSDGNNHYNFSEVDIDISQYSQDTEEELKNILTEYIQKEWYDSEIDNQIDYIISSIEEDQQEF